MQSFLGYAAKRPGAPERSRLALAQAFVAKVVFGFGQTKQLRERLLADAPLRRLLGFEPTYKLPSQATFSHAFGEFARIGLASQIHETLIRSHLDNTHSVKTKFLPHLDCPSADLNEYMTHVAKK